MTEKVKNEGIEEKSKPKDKLSNIVAQAAVLAVYHSHGAALVNMSASGIDPEAVIESLPSSYYHVSVQSILENNAHVPSEKSALVVTGYSGDLYKRRDEEDRVESFIRGTANNRDINGEKFSVLVLSDSLPDEYVFHYASLPWFNGPFQGDDSVWSIRRSSSGQAVELVRHSSEWKIVREPKIKEVRNWVDERTFSFDLS